MSNLDTSSANAGATATSEPAKVLSKKDVTKSMWIYYAGAELSNSYERLQSLVFCASMTPVLKKLYTKKEDLSEALKRHLIFFNTKERSAPSSRASPLPWRRRRPPAETCRTQRSRA